MKPFPFSANQSTLEKKFNYKLSKCRRVVENAFGQLKARFRRIGKGLEVHVDNAQKIVLACCILHNFCVDQRDVPPENSLDRDRAAQRNRKQPQHSTIQQNRDPEGCEVRNALAKRFELEGGSADGGS